MSIERLGPLDPISNYNKTQKAKQTKPSSERDSVNVSEEARLKAEVHRVSEEVQRAEDVRLDRIEEVKEKLKDPNYINDRIVNDVADKLLELFGLE